MHSVFIRLISSIIQHIFQLFSPYMQHACRYMYMVYPRHCCGFCADIYLNLAVPRSCDKPAPYHSFVPPNVDCCRLTSQPDRRSMKYCGSKERIQLFLCTSTVLCYLLCIKTPLKHVGFLCTINDAYCITLSHEFIQFSH